jgi:hypothetical protein
MSKSNELLCAHSGLAFGLLMAREHVVGNRACDQNHKRLKQ